MRSIRKALAALLSPRRPPTRLRAGDRPEVQLIYDGITYDVTESMIRRDRPGGHTLWTILGPQHLRMQRTGLTVATPELPPKTSLGLAIIPVEGTDLMRFKTREEELAGDND